MAAVGRPTMRAAAGSARWPREQTHPGRPRASQSKPAELQDAFQSARTASRSLLRSTSRCLEALGASERPGNVPGMLMYVARDFARWFFWTALRFERAYIAVELACAIQKCLALVHGAARSEPLSSRAAVDVAGRIISKVAAREGAIIPLRLVEHRDMWRDALLLDQPVQHRSCTVSGIADKPLRLEAEALLLFARSWSSRHRPRPGEWSGTPSTSTMTPNFTSIR